jgi:Domain of unknown function (DUF4383)
VAETTAAVFGGLYLLVGLVGFALVPGGGSLLGIFAVNGFHHAFHVVVGALGLLAAWRGWGRRYCQITGAVFIVLGLLGLVAPGLVATLLAHPTADIFTDNLLHLMSGLGFAYFGALAAPRAAANPAQPRA